MINMHCKKCRSQLTDNGKHYYNTQCLRDERAALIRLLEDCGSIFEKLGDENTYRLYEASPEMCGAIDNLEQAIARMTKDNA